MAEFNYIEYLKNNPLLKKEEKQPLTENQRPGYHPDGTPKSNAEMSDDEREDFYMNLDDVSEEKASTKMKASELKAKSAELGLDEEEIPTSTLTKINSKVTNVQTMAQAMLDFFNQVKEKENVDFESNADIKIVLDKLNKLAKTEKKEAETVAENEEASSKMKVSELKAKIKEDIMSLLQEEDKEEVNENDLESELMADLNEVTGETLSRIDGLTSLPLKQKFLNAFDEIYSDMVESGDPFDVMDVIDYLCGEMQRFAEDTGMGAENLEEAKKDEEDVEVEVEDEMEDLDVEDEMGGGDAEALDPEAGLTQDEQDIQNALKVAYDNAIALGDEKLSKQIGNTITMFTRTRVVNND